MIYYFFWINDNKTISNRINIINDTEHEVEITSFNSDGTSLDELFTDGI
ncbi:hypothetical protein [uncultured Methanobrevibacter sp.]|nr:hypothetical protein [uncultured Methanobrevibacter sp.]